MMIGMKGKTFIATPPQGGVWRAKRIYKCCLVAADLTPPCGGVAAGIKL